jgi:hypothetical protein
MTIFNLISKSAALDYLKSLDDLTVIDLPGAGDVKPQCPASVAVAVITGDSPHKWAASQNRWEWPIRDLIKALDN